jgi:CGNR zinc finger/Bacteriocin-protection, YdeI or OmpD-Associated
VLSAVARDAIDVFGTAAVRARLRRCSNPLCALLFVDSSRPGKRAWCTMRRCGNLSKLARYRTGRPLPPAGTPEVLMPRLDTSRLKRPIQPMPAFVRAALVRRRLMSAYRSRPAYQRNDYLSWITRARRDETVQKRLAQMLDELAAGDSYMKMSWRPTRRL